MKASFAMWSCNQVVICLGGLGSLTLDLDLESLIAISFVEEEIQGF